MTVSTFLTAFETLTAEPVEIKNEHSAVKFSEAVKNAEKATAEEKKITKRTTKNKI